MKTEYELQQIKNFFLANKGTYEGTIRGTAKYFGIAKSRMHELLKSKSMREISSTEEWKSILSQLEENKRLGHIRGGKTTQRKWERLK